MRRLWIALGTVALMASVILVTGVLSKCRVERGPGAGSAAARAKPALLLFCGAGIRPAAEALIRAYRASSGIEIHATYAGGGHLLGQIATLQKGDLFMPGEEFYVDKAIEKGLADAKTKRTVAYFVPVIFVTAGNPKRISALSDLTREGLRLGFGDERSCAVGRQTLELLRKNRVPLDAVAKNVVYKSSTVDELALAVRLGQVDAVIVWDATARRFARDGTAVPIPPEQNIPSLIPVVVLKSSQFPQEARDFVDFIASPQGQALLAENGYTVSLALDQNGKGGSQ